MATDSDGKLTEFESSVTVVTSEFANSIFGGLFGSGEGNKLEDDDPRVRGHVHDGDHIDGHAGKIHLVDHVESQLTNINLGDNAVLKRNIWQGEVEYAIPEYSVIEETGEIDPNGYYLDLRFIRSDFTFHEIESPNGASSEIAEQILIRQRKDDDADPSSWDDTYGYDFVFGSESLEDLNGAESETYGDNRLQFDKSLGAFRAGSVSEDQWDEANRGEYSTAFGRNNTASGNRSTVGGGRNNTASGGSSTIAGGDANTASSINAVVGGGYDNEASAIRTTIAGGYSNTVSAEGASVLGGTVNQATSDYSTIGGGQTNEASGTHSTIGGGQTNEASGTHSTIAGGNSNEASGTYSTIAGGGGNEVSGGYATIAGGGGNAASLTYAAIAGGKDNTASAIYSTIGGGQANSATSTHATIAGGLSNDASGTHSTIAGGRDNIASAPYSAIAGGDDNIASGNYSAIAGGDTNVTSGYYSTIAGGENNEATGSNSTTTGGEGNKAYGDHSFVGGGDSNEAGGTYSAVGGGFGNTASAESSVIAGGYTNNIFAGSDRSAVGGGDGNIISENSHCSFIGSGLTNNILDASGYSAIGGGTLNTIGETGHAEPSTYSFIGGGSDNDIYGASGFSSIVGGASNDICDGSVHSIIGGGTGNKVGVLGAVQPNACVTISGGEGNLVYGGSSHSVISGGYGNEMLNGALMSVTGGGYQNKISANNATIGGGTGNTISAVDSTIGGGSGNTVSGGGGTISGGLSNIVSGINAAVGGGTTNIVYSLNSSIAGGNTCTIVSDHCFIGGGEKNYIGDFSNHSVIVGGGGAWTMGAPAGDNNSINLEFTFGTVPFTSVLGATCNATSSWNSGIFAGIGGHINAGGADNPGTFGAGYGARTQNYIMGGDSNHIGAGDATSASYCSMLFGTGNEIVALGAESNLNRCHIGLGNKNWIFKDLKSSIDNMIIMSGTENIAYASRPTTGTIGNDIEDCIIVSGNKNRMYASGQEGPIESCMILGGHSNAFDSGGWDTVVIDGVPDPGGLGQGAQASSILGGSQNNIISTSGLDFFPNPAHPTDTTLCRTVVSTIVGGFVNKIEGSHGSVICGGGAVIENDSTTLQDAWDSGTGVHSGVTQTFGTAGGLADLLVPPYIPLGIPVSDTAQYNSGGNEINSSHYCGILSGTENIISDAEWSSISHGRGNLVEEVKEHEPNSYYDPVAFASANGKLSHSYSYGQASQASGEFQTSYLSSTPGGNWPADVFPGVHGGGVGSAQTFVLTMFGHWDYSSSFLLSPGPAGTAYECYLEGHDFSSAGPAFKFIPRTHSTYVFKIMGTLQCTAASDGRKQHTIAFSYNGGIACDGDGSFSYNATDIVKHFGNPTVTNDNSLGGQDFNIYFSHLGEDDLITGSSVGPLFTDRLGAGDLYIGTSVTPPQGLFITVENVSGAYITSSLVARIEMAECRLQYVLSAF